jgi:hypothetical protein
MAATTGQLGLVTPTQGTLSGTWGDTVNNGITEYVNIAIAGTLSFTGDGAITLANTTGTSAASNIGSTTAQYMVIRITGTLTTTKIITGPSYSKIYLVDNAATGGSVTFKASSQTGVSVAVGEKCFVYYNGADYVKTSNTLVSLTSGVTGILPVANGGTGVSTSTGSGSVVLSTSPTLVTPVLGTPTSGTLSACTVDGTNLVGYQNIPINSQSSSYTLVLADAGKSILHPSTDANDRTFTIPDNGSVAFPVGTAISFLNMANTVTIAITTDTMYLSGSGSTGSRTLAQYGAATAVKMTSTTWMISGNGLT